MLFISPINNIKHNITHNFLSKFSHWKFEENIKTRNIHTLLHHLLQLSISCYCQIFWSDTRVWLKISPWWLIGINFWVEDRVRSLDSKLDMILVFDRDWRLFCAMITSVWVAKTRRDVKERFLEKKDSIQPKSK
jgi:hypothetical protein